MWKGRGRGVVGVGGVWWVWEGMVGVGGVWWMWEGCGGCGKGVVGGGGVHIQWGEGHLPYFPKSLSPTFCTSMV